MNLKDISRQNWTTQGTLPTPEEIQAGALQRIADATEIAAKNYVAMQNDLERYKRWYQEEKVEKERLQRSIRAHKSNYTRLKNKLAQTEK